MSVHFIDSHPGVLGQALPFFHSYCQHSERPHSWIDMRAFTALYALTVSISALAAPVRRAATPNTILALRKFAVSLRCHQ